LPFRNKEGSRSRFPVQDELYHTEIGTRAPSRFDFFQATPFPTARDGDAVCRAIFQRNCHKFKVVRVISALFCDRRGSEDEAAAAVFDVPAVLADRSSCLRRGDFVPL
jgi:hypothetical protein